MHASHAILLAALTLAASASAQLSTTVISTNTGTYPLSICMTPQTPPQQFGLVSFWNGSQQMKVDVTNPVVPIIGSTSGPASQDQYCRGWFMNWFGGQLLTAHRGGGIRQWDATWATLTGVPPIFQLSATPTNYSHEGLKTFDQPGALPVVLYSEQHTSPTGSGGLILYRAGPNTLTFIGQTLQVAGANGAMDLSANGKYVWALGDQGNNNLNGVLRTYDTNNYLGNPILLNTQPLPYTVSWGDRYLERNFSQTTLVGTLGDDGIVTYNITNPALPAQVINFSAPGILHVRGVTYLTNSNWAVVWGHVIVNNVPVDVIWIFDTTIPGMLNNGVSFLPNFQVIDAKFAYGRLHCVGRNRNNLQSLLVIY